MRRRLKRRRRRRLILAGGALLCALLLAGAAFLFGRGGAGPRRTETWAQVRRGIAEALAENGDAELPLSPGTYAVDAPLELPAGARLTLTVPAGGRVTLRRAAGYAGAFLVSGGSLTLRGDLTLDGGREETAAGEALIRIEGGSCALRGVTLTANRAEGGKGGAMAVLAAERAELTDCVLSDCAAQYGGGLFCGDRTAEISLTRCRVSGCASRKSGGGVYARGQLRLTDCAVTGNTAGTYGGGLMVKTGLTMTGGEISGNRVTGGPGGGVRLDGGNNALTGVRVTGNSASTRCGGIDGGLAPFTLTDCEVAGNTAPAAADCYPESWRDVDWSEDENLKLTDVTVEVKKEIPRTGDLQGMTLAGSRLVFLSVGRQAGLHVYDLDSLEETRFLPGVTFRHGNDMTWNPVSGELLATNVAARKDREDAIARFRLTEGGEMTEPVFASAAHAYAGLAFREDTGGWIARCQDRICLLDPGFRELSGFDALTPLTRQGLAYRDGLVFLGAWESGWVLNGQQRFSSREKGSSLIHVFSLSGELKRTLRLPENVRPGELEGLSFAEDGTMWLMIQTREKWLICVCGDWRKALEDG